MKTAGSAVGRRGVPNICPETNRFFKDKKKQ